MSTRLLSAALLILVASGASACGSTVTSPTAATTTAFAFSSRIQENGSAWRSFTVATAGSVTLQLTSVTQGDAVLELGLGTVNGTNCVISQSIQTAPNATASSPQITANLGVGTYCVRVKDVGILTTIVDFNVVVIIPV